MANKKQSPIIDKEKVETVKKIKTTKKLVEVPVEATKIPRTPRSAKNVVASGLTVNVYDAKGATVETMVLPESVFKVKINKPLINQAIRVYLANQRQGTASTKTRGEVTGSTRKIYQQKGTGRARHGGIRAPIFVHGGIAHGPKPRSYNLDMPQKMKRAALSSVLSAKYADGKVSVVSGFQALEPKTKVMLAAIQSLSLSGKTTLILLPSLLDTTIRSLRNIKHVDYLTVQNVHAYDVLTHANVVFFKESIPVVEDMFKKEK